jgi:membrane protease YdiL (CAAX protease family)
VSVARSRGEAAVLAAGMAGPTLATWLYFRTFAEAPWMPVLYAALKVAQFALPVAWLGVAGPAAWRPALRPGGGLGAGVATGVAMAAAVAGLAAPMMSSDLAAAAGPRIAARLHALGVATPARYLLLAVFLAAVHSFLEEYYWRWFVHGRLRARLGPAAATAASSLSFMSHHVVVLATFAGAARFWPATAALSLAVAAAGAVWAWLYERGGGLVAPWVSHLVADAAILAVGWGLARGHL